MTTTKKKILESIILCLPTPPIEHLKMFKYSKHLDHLNSVRVVETIKAIANLEEALE